MTKDDAYKKGIESAKYLIKNSDKISKQMNAGQVENDDKDAMAFGFKVVFIIISEFEKTIKKEKNQDELLSSFQDGMKSVFEQNLQDFVLSY